MGDEQYYTDLGHRLARGEAAMHDPFWPPLYGEFLGYCGETGHLNATVIAAQIGLWAVTGLLLFLMAKRLGADATTTMIATGLYFTSTELVAFSHFFWPETLHLFLFTAAIWLLLSDQSKLRFFAWTLLGLCLLTKSLLLVSIVVLILYRFVQRPSYAALTIPILGIVIAFLAVLGFRGQVISYLGKSAAFNVLVGLHENHFHDHREDIAGKFYQSYGTDYDTRQKRILDELKHSWRPIPAIKGVPRHLARVFDRHSFLINQLPEGDYARYAGPRKWYHQVIQTWTQLHLLVALCAVVVGIWMWPQKDSIPFLAALIVPCVFIFSLIHTKSRFLVQFLPLIYLCAALGLRNFKNIRKLTFRQIVISGFLWIFIMAAFFAP